MIFSSLLFLFRFLPIVLILYYAVPFKYRNCILFISSLIFYSWGEPVYIVLMLFSTVFDFYNGKHVYKLKTEGNLKKAKIFIIFSVIVNLSLLGFFKYCDFFMGSLNNIFGLDVEFLNIALPVGISFYIFQTMSYCLDIYLNDEKPQKKIIAFGTYVALFPQLIAGPIVRYKDISAELVKRNENFDDFAYGITRFVAGLGKKVLLANNIGMIWDSYKVMEGSQISVFGAWLGITCFAFQIYFDFSGYSDMAIGLGKMFGFTFPENFNYPYISRSLTEFWRRWHISLGTWFREYVYIPLGGNRCKVTRNIFNIFLVWFLTGFWHGASYNFIIWGMYFGIILIFEKMFLLKILKKIKPIFSNIYAITLILTGWVMFEFTDMQSLIHYLKVMWGLSGNSLIDADTLFILKENAVLFIILIIGVTPLPIKLVTFVKEKYLMGKGVIIAFAASNIYNLAIMTVSLFYLVDASYNPFLYFRF